MNCALQKRKEKASSALTPTFLGILLFSASFALAAYAADPSWWSNSGTGSEPAIMTEEVMTNGGVVTTNYVPNPTGVVNQGQLKQFTVRAVDELNATLPGGAGTNLNTMVSNWAQDYLTNGYSSTNIKPSDYTAMTVGQLKTIGGMVYGRLAANGYTNLVPSWLPGDSTYNTNAAVIGQLKQVFNFDFSVPGATNLIATPESGAVALHWSSTTTNSAPWIVEEQGTNGSWTFVATLANAADSYTVTGLNSGQGYNFQVFAAGTNNVSHAVGASAAPFYVPPSGLAVWLKADAGLSQSAGVVTAWADQGTNGNNASPGATPPTVITDANGFTAVHFDGSGNNFLKITDNSSLDQNHVTILAAVKDNGPGSAQYLVCRPYSTGGPSNFGGWVDPFLSYAALLSRSSTTYQDGFVTPVSGTVTENGNANTYDPGNLHAFSWRYDGTNQVAFTDGRLASSVPTTGNINYSGGAADLTIGVHSSTDLRPLYDEALDADVYEILVYNRALTDSELSQVETYLSVKYNLPDFPAPIITPNGGTFSSSATVNLVSFAPSADVIHYTVDGSNPTALSPAYTGPITLTGSRPVTAALFHGSEPVSPVASAQFYVGDTGGIGISDAWQTEYFGHTGIDPNALTPGGSGLTNLQAYLGGYNPNMYSTNGDGLSDLVNLELGYSGTDTDINGYTDANGNPITNAEQLAMGLDPFDTGINPTPPTPPTPNPSDHTAPVITLDAPTGATLLP